MSDAIHGWLAAIGAHPLLVLAVVFVVACAESIALIGTIVPAGAVMFAAGTLIGAGALDAWTTLGVAAVGAIVGDGVSYELGRRYRGAIRNGWVRFGYANAYARGEQFVLRHGMKSIVLARFLAPVRAVVPVVVGCATLPRRAFYPVNIVSALIWALVHVAPGILFGASAALAAAISVRVAAILLVVAALVALVWIGVRLTLRRGWPLLRRIAAAGMHACARRWPRFGTRLHAAIEALRRLPGAVPVLALLFVGCVWLFGDVVRDVVANDPLTHADIALYSFLQNLRTPPVDAAMRALAVLHGRDTGLIVAAAFLVWLMIHRCWLTSAWWAATVGVAVVLAPAFGAGALGTTPASLPPGTLHVPLPDADAAFAIVASSGIGWLLARDRPAWRVPVVTAVVLWIVLGGFARLYVGDTWLSGLIGGWSLGLAWFAVLAATYAYWRVREHVQPRGALVALVVVTATAGVWTVPAQWALDRAARPHVGDVVAMTVDQWLRGGWQRVPVRRTEIGGDREEYLPLQWCATSDTLDRHLSLAGWQRATPWSPASALRWLLPQAQADALPVLPRYTHGESTRREFVRVDPRGRTAVSCCGCGVIRTCCRTRSARGRQVRRAVSRDAASARAADDDRAHDDGRRCGRDCAGTRRRAEARTPPADMHAAPATVVLVWMVQP
jgi:membrane protein DedA with SNARE-associated domain